MKAEPRSCDDGQCEQNQAVAFKTIPFRRVFCRSKRPGLGPLLQTGPARCFRRCNGRDDGIALTLQGLIASSPWLSHHGACTSARNRERGAFSLRGYGAVRRACWLSCGTWTAGPKSPRRLGRRISCGRRSCKSRRRPSRWSRQCKAQRGQTACRAGSSRPGWAAVSRPSR
jgi:hypothetical protein